MTSLHLRIGILCSTILFNFSSPCAGKDLPKESFIKAKEQTISFTENKGQVFGYDGLPHPEVKFSFQQGSTQIFLLESGIAYQFTKKHYPVGYQELMNNRNALDDSEKFKALKNQVRTETFRMDMTLTGADQHAVITSEDRSADYINFYNFNVMDVHTYKKITYHNIYPGIDWVIYTTTNTIKYDFVVKAGADPSLIKMNYKHHEEFKLNADGSFTLKNSLGEISEKTPISFQNENAITTHFVLKKDEISFYLEKYDSTQTLIIDPTLLWSTYYGGIGMDYGFDCSTDPSGNVYLLGNTESTASIASAGHQNVFGGGNVDVYLVKFNSGGVLQWATYYGGTNDEYGWACTTDGMNNVYLAGETESFNNIASGGHQNAYGGGTRDAFLVKFNSIGVRQWGTYYGDSGKDYGVSCSSDVFGNVYLAGKTDSGNNIASGGYQNVFGGGIIDAFVVKFNSSGVRQWASYYGDTGDDVGTSCSTDLLGNVYLAGITSSTNNISFAGHQNIFGGGLKDGFLVKFGSNGFRLWATYYGGTNDDYNYGCKVDAMANVYLVGKTKSTNNIASGGHQNVYGGGLYDAFIVKFNSNGLRLWATYYGSSGYDESESCTTDVSGNVYLSGFTNSTAGIALNGYQNTLAGSFDAFLVKFNSSGVHQWGTYFGGTIDDYGYSCASDALGNVYLAGRTSSTINIATGGYQSTYGGGVCDAFLAKLLVCVLPPSPINTTPLPNLMVCGTGSTTLSASGTGTINWYTSSTSQSAIATGTAFITPNLSIGTYTYYVADNTCAPSASRTAIILTVSPMPLVNAYSTNSVTCAGQNAALASNGASSYTWFPGNLNGSLVFVTPSVTTSYTVYGSLGGICQNSAVVTQSIVANPSISVNSGTLCSGNIFTIQPLGANVYTIEGGSALVSPLVNTSYTVSGALNSGCLSANIATCIVTVLQSPTVSASASPTLICPGESSILNASGGLSYTWTPAVPLTSIVNPLSTVNYSLSVSGSNACISTSVITISVDACVGLNTQSENEASIQIYPNPNAGIFTIELKEGASFSVYDVLGKRLFSKNLMAGKQIMNLNNFANGIYYLKIESKNQSKNLKLIKE